MNEVRHFAIHATDVERAKQFYERVFDWKMGSYPGARDFYQLSSPEGNVIGAIQARHFSPVSKEVFGYECSVTVTDVDSTLQEIERAGGTIALAKTAIPGVGWVAKCEDTEGNLFCVIQYDTSAK